MIGGIAVGSTIKGLITGLAIGFFARKVNSIVWGTAFGLAVRCCPSVRVSPSSIRSTCRR
jgi:hypothetical protein